METKTFRAVFIVIVALCYVRQIAGITDTVVPGAKIMSVGLDIVKAKYLANPIFAFTYFNNVTWTNPQQPTLTYSVPDQISVVDVPHIDEQCVATSFASTVEVQQAQIYQYGISAKIFRMGMGAESTISQFSRKTFAQKQFLGEAHIVVSCFNQGLVGNATSFLDSDFNAALNDLPLQLNEMNLLAYRNFIRTYGTHYYNFITFGGIASMLTQMDQKLATYYSVSALNQQISAEFFVLSDSFTGISGSGTVDSFFSSSSSSHIYLVGGNTSSYLPSEWQYWVHTVYYDPVPISSLITPISQLAVDPTIRTNLQTVVAGYLNESAATYCGQDLCSDHGDCNTSGGCTCNQGWIGVNCEIEESPPQVYLQNSQLGWCINIRGGTGTSAGTNLQSYSCWNNNNNSGFLDPANVWQFYSDGTIRNPTNGLCIGVYNQGTVNWTPLVTSECENNGEIPWWNIWSYNSDSTILNPYSQLCMNVDSSTYGYNIQLYDCSAGDASWWNVMTIPRQIQP